VSVFARRSAQPEERGLTWPGYPHPPSQFAGWNPSGVAVTLESYTRSAAASACVRVLVSTVKKLPVDQVRVDNGRRVPIAASPIVRRPSANVSRRGFVAQVMRSLCSAGNVYGDVVATRPGTMLPAQIELINPSRASWDGSSGQWVCRIDGKPRDRWPLGDLWHMPATDFLPAGQPHALSPVELAATSIGTGLAAEEFGARFFGDGAHPSSIVYSEQPLTAEQADAIKQSILNSWRGNRAPAVLGAGLRHEKVSVDPKDSQFIDLLRFEVEQACRWWGVPPSMVYAAISGQNVTYSNVSQSDLAFLKHSVDNWLVDIEDAWSEFLPSPQIVKFNTSALLRMDDEARWKVHDLRLKNKTTTVNAVRALEDELPFPDPEFDEPGIPGGPTITPTEAPQ
jgi:HK97 family phage portal protein